MKRSGYSPGSWVHVFSLRERVVSTVEVLEEPRDVEYIATLADGTVEETERVLDRLVEEGVARVVDGKYDADRTGAARRPSDRYDGIDASELDAETLRRVEAAVRAFRDAESEASYSEMSEYRKGRTEGYASVLSMLSELLAEIDDGRNGRLDPT